MQSPAQGTTLVHLVVARRVMNPQKLRLMNYPMMPSRTTMKLRKKLHRFQLMTIRKVRNLKKFRNLRQLRHLAQWIRLQSRAPEAAVHMHLKLNIERLTLQATLGITIGLALMFSKRSGTYGPRTRE